MQGSVGGGGFFFSAFTTTQSLILNPFSDIVAGSYGGYYHSTPLKLINAGRWLCMVVNPINQYPPSAFYTFKLALGSAGNEVDWQPSDGTGFFIDWRRSWISYGIPFQMSFPISIPKNADISANLSIDVPVQLGIAYNLWIVLYIYG